MRTSTGHSLKRDLALSITALALGLTACAGKPACPAGSISYLPDASAFPAAGPFDGSPPPVEMKIGGQTIQVGRVVHGPFCNLTLSGTVYVACDLQIPAWDQEAAPTFLEECDFNVEPGTVIYVAAHNDAAYYQGCSCHTSK